jgi:LysR family transcriptional activator of nhaA
MQEMWLNYQQLQYFREIAKLGSIKAASESLRISSPALSMQLKALEETLGNPLFIRGKNKLILTDFGTYVLEYAEKIFSTGEELLSNINNDFVKSTINIGVNSGLPKTMTNALIQYILKEYPDAKIKITEGDDKRLRRDLLSRECDLILTNTILNDANDSIKSELVYKSDLSVYGTSKFQKLKAGFPLSLHKHPFILPIINSTLRQLIDQWFLINKIQYTELIEIHDSASKKMLSQEGVGLVVLAKVGAIDLIKNKKLALIGEMNVQENFYCCTRKGEVYSKSIVERIIKSFEEIMNETMQD